MTNDELVKEVRETTGAFLVCLARVLRLYELNHHGKESSLPLFREELDAHFHQVIRDFPIDPRTKIRLQQLKDRLDDLLDKEDGSDSSSQ